ncbi:Metallo-dependent phosphatase-like protein [Coprinopsis sp. MPI-PUGE-AT-0042]|nr:Metallo-dependent phosphatase-like protein [Coprinopsis sp. MPI-PUGE-AT-0042]
MTIWTRLLANFLSWSLLQSLAAPQQQFSGYTSLDPYPALGKPRITFNDDGTFKVTVFSDLHFGENEEGPWGPEQDLNSTRVMKRVLKDEKPGYVVLNGDLVTGENTFKENVTSYLDQIIAPLNDAHVPFSSTQGNHDNQVNVTHLEEILHEQKLAPLSYTRVAPRNVGGQQGEGNYWVPVYRSHSAVTPDLILWFFDSRGGFAASADQGQTPVPDWVDSSVATWLQAELARMDAAWGSSKKRGALAFMHIPPSAIKVLQSTLDSKKNPGQNADTLGNGSVQAADDEPFWDALTKIPNLHAIVSGHDHGNEWCAREPKKDVIFCFDKHSGYGGYGKYEWGFGVRNIVFRNTDPRSPVDTWIRLEEGEIRAQVVLDQNYGRLEVDSHLAGIFTSDELRR